MLLQRSTARTPSMTSTYSITNVLQNRCHHGGPTQAMIDGTSVKTKFDRSCTHGNRVWPRYNRNRSFLTRGLSHDRGLASTCARWFARARPARNHILILPVGLSSPTTTFVL